MTPETSSTLLDCEKVPTRGVRCKKARPADCMPDTPPELARNGFWENPSDSAGFLPRGTRRAADLSTLVVAAEAAGGGPSTTPPAPAEERALRARRGALGVGHDASLGKGEPLGLPEGHELLGEVLDLAQGAHLVGGHEGKGDARLARAAGAPDAVQDVYKRQR